MHLKGFIISLCISLVFGDPDFSVDKEIKAELEVAVHDSAILADELNEMLSHFDDEEDEATFENLTKDLEKALKVTEQLADAAEKQGFKVGRVKNENGKILKNEKTDLEQLDFDLGTLLEEHETIDIEEDEELADIDELTNDLEEALKVTETISKSNVKLKTGQRKLNEILKKKDRKSKQLRLTLQDLLSDSDDIPIDEDKNKAIVDDSKLGRKGKGFTSTDDNVSDGPETCTHANPTTKSKYCTPRFRVKNIPTKFHTHEPYDDKYCYIKNQTVCTTTFKAVDKNICTYVYRQKSHDISIANLRVSLATQSEKFSSTTCRHVESSGYGYPPEEVCEETFVTEHFSIPIVDEEFLDQEVLSYPEPTQVCFLWPGYQVPEVQCSEESVEHCVVTSYLRDDQVSVESDGIVLRARGECEEVELELSQDLCTVERNIKSETPRRPLRYQG